MRTIGFIILLLSFFLSGCIPNAQPEIFLIPNNFVGTVLILFEQKNGEEKKYNDNARIYNISNSGILSSKFLKTLHGKLDQQIYYVDSVGNKNVQIPDGLSKSVKEDEVCIMNGVYGNFFKATTKPVKDNFRVQFLSFSVGKFKSKRQNIIQ
jgi:hypothetical protein